MPLNEDYLKSSIEWKLGDPIHAPQFQMIELDPSSLSVRDNYKLLIGAIIPRPIALVSTISSQGTYNLAPFSFFNGVSSNPPTLMVAIARKADGQKKDSLINIENTKDFVVNVSSEWLIGPISHCGSEYPFGVSEFEVTGLTPLSSTKVKSPRVKEAAIQFECKLYSSQHVGDNTAGSATMVIGHIVCVHVPKEAYKDGRINAEIIKPVARLGGTNYMNMGNIVSVPTPRAGAEKSL